MAFFDTATSNADLLHGLREEALAYQEAVSDKLGSFLQGLACFVGALVGAWQAGRGVLAPPAASWGYAGAAEQQSTSSC